MQLKTILNRVTNYKSFVVGKVKWAEDSEALSLEVEMRPRANGHPICSGCGGKAPGYDRSRTPRRFEFVPMWMISVVVLYCMRRVNCPTCGVKVERVPWAEGKSPLTTEYKWFLARWARRMSWKEVSEAFRVSWDSVYTAVKQAVSWGLEHRDLEGIEAIGVDEVQWHKGHQYQTVVYQLDEGRKRLLWIGPDRRAKTLLRLFRFLGNERTAEVKQLKADGYEPVLKGARWLLLKRPENQTERQAAKLQEILQYNLKWIRSHLMKEDFQLVRGRGPTLQRHRRGLQQQTQTDHQKIVRLPYPRSLRNRPIPHARCLTRAKIYP